MKPFIIIACLAVTACCSSKKGSSTATSNTDTTIVDSIRVAEVPDCIDSLINIFRVDKVQNPPRKIYRYTYNNKTVYYVPAICCDFYSDLYDDKCQLLGHPDGGFTGKGDGSLPDFNAQKKNEELVWQDKRK